MLRRSVFGSLAALFLPAIVGSPASSELIKSGSLKLTQGTTLRNLTYDIDSSKIADVVAKTLKSTGFMMPDGTKLIPFDNSVDDSDWYNVSSSG